MRYDIEGLDASAFDAAIKTVFEPAVDTVCHSRFDMQPGDIAFAVEYLPGQYDQRADSAAQCTEPACRQRPAVKCATVYVLSGISRDDAEDIKNTSSTRWIPRSLARAAGNAGGKTARAGRRAGAHRLHGWTKTGSKRCSPVRPGDERETDIACVRQYFRDDEQRDPRWRNCA